MQRAFQLVTYLLLIGVIAGLLVWNKILQARIDRCMAPENAAANLVHALSQPHGVERAVVGAVQSLGTLPAPKAAPAPATVPIPVQPATNEGQSDDGNFHVMNFMPAIVEIPAGRVAAYQATVPEQAESIMVSGEFSAAGGSGNDVQVILTSKAGFMDLQGGRPAQSFYDSGKVSKGEMAVRNLPAGSSLVLVVSNKFSVISAKRVTGKIVLSYTQR